MEGFFTIIPNRIITTPALTHIEKSILIYLMCRAGNDSTCYPSHKTISEECGLSISSVKRGIKTLESKGYISIKGRFSRSGKKTSGLFTINVKVGAEELFDMLEKHWTKQKTTENTSVV